MSKRVLRQIRNAVRLGNYNMTRHAVDEMAEDNLGIFDIEHAVLSGTITKIELDDLRGVKYTIIGLSQDRLIEVGVAGRFIKKDTYLIITAYQVLD